MERIKRQQTVMLQNYVSNKKQKLENEITPIKSSFEDLANEIIYEIFEYLDIYHVYNGFLDLNKRFKHLLNNSNLPIQINISTISKSHFERYSKQIILPNKHRINILRLSNPFTVNLVLSPAYMIYKFIQLEILILDNICTKYLNNILKHSIHLPKLHSLVLNLAEHVQTKSNICFNHIFRLPKLKYFKITYQTKDDQNPLITFFDAYQRSSIEHLVINGRFLFDSFDDLLHCLPKLRHLSIDCLVETPEIDISLTPMERKYLKYISLKLDNIHFIQLENLIKHFFRHVEILRLTTGSDQSYLNAIRWQHLISSFMPNLRVFDVNHTSIVSDQDPVTYHNLINQFNSSFWIEKQWFFTHQHDCPERLDSGMFYSTDPYRRKTYTVYWAVDNQDCPHLQEPNLNSVNHVHICIMHATNTYVNYFPNATELTIKHFEIPEYSISTTLNRIVPLEQLKKLAFETFDIPFKEIIQLIRFTPNLHTLKVDLLCLYRIDMELLTQNENYQYVSNTNKIKHLDTRGCCTLETMEFIITLFPKIECLKTGINRNEIHQILRFLLSKTNINTRHLVFLCMKDIPKICLQELNIFIRFGKLLDDYLIQFINRDLYLWW